MLELIAGPLAAYAQAPSTLSGTVFDLTGKPYPDVTITITNVATNKASEVMTDAKGHYTVSGLTGGDYNVDFKAKDETQKDQLI